MSKAMIRLAKVSGAYLGAAVLALETYNALTAPLDLPSWIFWLVVLALASGLPLVVVAAIRFIKDDPDIEADPWMVRAPRTLMAGTVALVLAGGGGIAWWVVASDSGIRALEHEGPSVAVIPFQNQSPDPADGYFAEGLTAELTRVFAQVQDIKVLAGGAAVELKENRPASSEIARELGARTFLEGSVQKSGDRIRVTASLMSTEGDVVLWSEKYDRELTDAFALQDEISAAIVQELTPTVARSKSAPGFDGGTRNASAYDHYLRGRALAARGTAADVAAAAEAFRAALAADPEFVAARDALEGLSG